MKAARSASLGPQQRPLTGNRLKSNFLSGPRYSTLATALLLTLPTAGLIAQGTQVTGGQPEPLADQWELVGEAVNEPGWHIWGSSPIRDDAGKIHLFAERWPTRIPFNAGWRFHSEIAHYVADGPEEPFRYVRSLGKGGGTGWDAGGYYNSNIQRVGDKYVLVFVSHDGAAAHGPNQRIGMMIADDLDGPWKLIPNDTTPLLSPPEDSSIWCHDSGSGVNNPALLPHPDGRFLLYFKAMSGPRPQGKLSMGVAIADKLEGPYVIQKDPVTANERIIEDGYAFMWRDHVCLMTTDNQGILEEGGGLIWVSEDGIRFSEQPLKGFHNFNDFYLNDQSREKMILYRGNKAKFERPQLLMGQDGEPEYLYCPSGAALDGSDGTNAYILRLK